MKSKVFFVISFLLWVFCIPASRAAIPMANQQVEIPTIFPKQEPGKSVKRPDKPRSENINGILSMSFGIGSLVIFPLLSIPALILGGISLTKKEPKNGYATAGLITGGLGVLYLIILIFLLIALQ